MSTPRRLAFLLAISWLFVPPLFALSYALSGIPSQSPAVLIVVTWLYTVWSTGEFCSVLAKAAFEQTVAELDAKRDELLAENDKLRSRAQAAGIVGAINAAHERAMRGDRVVCTECGGRGGSHEPGCPGGVYVYADGELPRG